MFKFGFVLYVVIALVRAQTTEVSQCINHSGDLPINTNIVGCVTPPCLFPSLSTASINLIFRAPYTMHTMRTLATAYLSVGIITIPVPYDLEDQAWTCNFLTNTYCPVVAGEVIAYSLLMFIDPLFFVGTSATVEFRVVDDNNVPVVCIRVPIRIIEAETSDRAGNFTLPAKV